MIQHAKVTQRKIYFIRQTYDTSVRWTQMSYILSSYINFLIWRH